MATSKLSFQTAVEEELTCAICLEPYNQSPKLPKLLPCGHTFCMSCLAQYAHRHLYGQFQCPLCKRMIQLRSEDVEELPNNLAYISLLDKLERVSVSTGSERKGPTCTAHGQHCDKVCMSCQQGLCSECFENIVISGKNPHTGHRIIELVKAKDELIEELCMMFDKLVQTCTRYTEANVTKVNQYKMSVSKVKEDINKDFDNAVVFLKKWKDESLKKLQAISPNRTFDHRVQVLQAEVRDTIAKVSSDDCDYIFKSESLSVHNKVDAFCQEVIEGTTNYPTLPQITYNKLAMSQAGISLGKVVVGTREPVQTMKEPQRTRVLHNTKANSLCEFCGKDFGTSPLHGVGYCSGQPIENKYNQIENHIRFLDYKCAPLRALYISCPCQAEEK